MICSLMTSTSEFREGEIIRSIFASMYHGIMNRIRLFSMTASGRSVLACSGVLISQLVLNFFNQIYVGCVADISLACGSLES